jgi:hypothetical protein
MTQWNDAPLDEIRGLVDERTRYEGWLSALDQRRDVVPGHVLDRVRQDYEGRVERVVAALATHADVLREGVGTLEGRDAELRRTIGEREDALAEVELRALVGEFDEAEANRRREEVNGALGALRGEAERGGAKLAELRALLDRAAPAPPAPTAAPALAEAPARARAGAADPLAGLDLVDGTPDRAIATRPREDAGAVMDAAFAGGEVRPGTAPGMPASIPTMPGGRDPFGGPPGFGGVTGGMVGGAVGGVGFGPTATPAEPMSGVAAGAPQEKTLRCPDCGAMNYATEWYCERCGGELAAM